MRKYKKIGVELATLIVVISLLSTTTLAIPLNQNKEAVENNEESPYGFLNGIEQLGDDPDIEEELTKIYNDESFRTKFNELFHQIAGKLLELRDNYGYDYDLLESFFKVQETFSLKKLFDRIKMVDTDTVLTDIQEILEIPDSEDDFKAFHEAESEEFINILCRNDNPHPDSTGLHDFIQFVCDALRTISLIWHVPLGLTYGTLGLLLGNLISVVIFGPISVYLVISESCMDALEYEEGLDDEIEQIIVKYGIPGVIAAAVKLLSEAWENGYVQQATVEVWKELLLSEYEPFDTAETAPVAMNIKGPSSAYQGDRVTFTATVIDNDMISDGDIKQYRDYVQVGWDFNGDKKVDSWSSIKNNYATGTKIEVKRTFSSTGTYKVSFLPRDHWGATGEWSDTITIKISTSKSVVRPMFQFLSNNFPRIYEIFVYYLNL